jgi:hypothetical protein
MVEITNLEQKNLEKNEENVTFNLDNENNLNELKESLEVQSLWFNPQRDVTYKLKLTSPEMVQIQKEFDGDTVIKYSLQIEASNEAGETFTGTWDVGKTVIKQIVKAAESSDESVTKLSFKVTKTGMNKDTRYNIVKDF